MEGLSERAYAVHAGISRGAVQKARKTGRLVLYADGSINAAASDARRAQMTDPDQQRRSTKASSAAERTVTGAVRNANTSATTTGASSASTITGPGESTSYLKARTALTVYQAQERQLAIQKKKGVLVDRARAETLVFRLARQERDAWVTWPTRVAALMAAQLAAEIDGATGVPMVIEPALVQRVLEAHVREQLDALADLRVTLE
jgi:hypothetical protein